MRTLALARLGLITILAASLVWQLEIDISQPSRTWNGLLFVVVMLGVAAVILTGPRGDRSSQGKERRGPFVVFWLGAGLVLATLAIKLVPATRLHILVDGLLILALGVVGYAVSRERVSSSANV